MPLDVALEAPKDFIYLFIYLHMNNRFIEGLRDHRKTRGGIATNQERDLTEQSVNPRRQKAV